MKTKEEQIQIPHFPSAGAERLRILEAECFLDRPIYTTAADRVKGQPHRGFGVAVSRLHSNSA